MNAGVQQVDGHRRVILVRDAEDGRVDVRHRVPVVAIAGRDAELVLHVLDAIRRRIDDRHGLDAGGARERRQVDAFGGGAGADYADTDRSHDSAALHWGSFASARRS